MIINPLTAIDFYKADHRNQYPKGTTEVYSNLTPRSRRLANVLDDFDDQVVVFGLQYFIKHFLQQSWYQYFFNQPKDKVVKAYQRRMDNALGKGAITVEHIEALHDLGYLPLKIKSIAEGERVSIGVPILTVVNTHPDFFWLTNYIETVMSCYLWKPMTAATTAFEYKRLLTKMALKTGSDLDFIPFQAHDFSFRGLSSLQDSGATGAAHLTSFWGTDTITAIDFCEDYYLADSETQPVGFSVPATEHSVMCMGTQLGELDTFKRLITETYPSGIVSIVSDTWDLWKVVTDYVSRLKDEIIKRDGKLVIRPDSGNPTDIICGNKNAPKGSAEYKGVVECLWDTFGGSITTTGHKLLDPHIGVIYGDSVSLKIATDILTRLVEKGYASGNIVFGVGSFTYQYVTRDSYGFAMKATSGVVNGQRRDIFKDPKTDNGTKKSAKGLLRVERENGRLILHDQQTEEQEQQGELKVVYEDGKLIEDTSLTEIRARLDRALQQLLSQGEHRATQA